MAKIFEYPEDMTYEYKPRMHIICTEVDTGEKRLFSSSSLYSYRGTYISNYDGGFKAIMEYFAQCEVCEQPYHFRDSKIITEVEPKPIVLCNNCVIKYLLEGSDSLGGLAVWKVDR